MDKQAFGEPHEQYPDIIASLTTPNKTRRIKKDVPQNASWVNWFEISANHGTAWGN